MNDARVKARTSPISKLLDFRMGFRLVNTGNSGPGTSSARVVRTSKNVEQDTERTGSSESNINSYRVRVGVDKR